MALLDERSEDALTGGRGGDHLILWYLSDRTRARCIASFLNAGGDSDDVLVLMLPLRELGDLERSMKRESVSIEKMLGLGKLAVFASEELLPCKRNKCVKLHDTLEELRGMVKTDGRGLRIVGRLAPVLFERGDVEGALAVERTADAALGNARLLCLYDGRRMTDIDSGPGRLIDDIHTHTLREDKDGRVRLEKTRRRRLTRRSH